MNAASLLTLIMMVLANLLAFLSTVRNISIACVSIRLILARAAFTLSSSLSVTIFNKAIHLKY